MDQQTTETLPKKAAFFKENTAAILSALALALASVALAFSDLPYVALPIAFLLVAYVAVMSRRPGPIILASITLTLPGFLLGDFLPGAFALALYVAVAAGASLNFLKKTPVFSLLASALAFGLCALISGGLLSRALPALFPLPAYLLLSLAHLRRERRSIATLAVQAGFLIVVIALVVTAFFKTYGTLDRETILSVADNFRAGLLESLKSLRDELVASFREVELEVPAILQPFLEDETLQSAVRTLTVLLPGIVTAGCGLLAFLGHSLFLALRQNEGDDFAKAPESILFFMGVPSAVIYLLSLVLAIFLDPSSLPYAVAENFSIILLFPFFFAGLQRLIGFFILAPKGARWLFILLFFSVACCLSAGVVELLALYAAFETIFMPIRKRARLRRSGPDDPDQND